MKTSLIVGSGGLFGFAIKNILPNYGRSSFELSQPLTWNALEILLEQFRRNINQYLKVCEKSQEWQIIWAAGKSTMRSDAAEAELETVIFNHFLGILEEELSKFNYPGTFGFCSSAGSIYAGCREQIITEKTPEAPTTPYAKNKIAQELILTDWFNKNTNCQNILIARMSNLYSPLQNAQKKQGLISHIANCMLHDQKIQIFVPLNTRRDYIWADDAAKIFMHILNENSVEKINPIRIIAQEESASIQEIISIFKEITGKNPLITNIVDPLSAAYPLTIQLKSAHPIQASLPIKISLREGIQKIWDAKNR
jgi:UDP-glucose 4-epimerase